MNESTTRAIKKEILKSKLGMAGTVILAMLILMSVVAIVTIPVDTFKEWNNPGNWISYPKVASPAWLNLFLSEKIPEHKILDKPTEFQDKIGDITIVSNQFRVDFEYDDFPNDFIYEFEGQYVGAPLLQISVIRPDEIKLHLISMQLPNFESTTIHGERVFSTDKMIRKNIQLQSTPFNFPLEKLSTEDIVFSQIDSNKTLKGEYVFVVNVYGNDFNVDVLKSKMIIGGKSFGALGTDELRRDLSIGLLWGTPLALFIGITVSISSVTLGLLYGVYAGYKGKSSDEIMMRFNDVIYALPALPFLIILSVTISNSIFLMIGFLMVFGWVGIAKVARSMSLQIKTRGYVEASEIMGQKSSKIILRHILPQLLPYAFASIAISVPAAITTEAGLSFLGLGDPSFPTWGQILHDASVYGATSRGIWWWIIPPGMMIAITGLAFVFIGNAFDTIVNPRLKR